MKNMITRTNIDWVDYVWNSVWGCLNKCPYCYARNIAKRFGDQIAEKDAVYHYLHKNKTMDSDVTIKKGNEIKDFKPTWIESNFVKEFPKKPSKIFVNSMSDISYWKPEWVYRVIDKIKLHPDHKFLFLTKTPEVYFNYTWPDNCWLGVTATNEKDFIYAQDYAHLLKNCFVSIEPLQEFIHLRQIFDVINGFKWVILGAETGKRKNE